MISTPACAAAWPAACRSFRIARSSTILSKRMKMGSSSSGFLRRPRLMNLASSAGVMPLWGMVAFDDVELEYPPPGRVFVVLCHSNNERGSKPNNAANNESTKGCPTKAGAPVMLVGFRCGVLLAQTLS